MAINKTPRNKRDVVYVVVWVYRGVIDTVEAHHDEDTAQARVDFLKQDINPDYAEVGVFEVGVGAQSTDG